MFQDIDGFSLEDYKPFANVEAGFDRVVQFLSAAMSEKGQQVKRLDGNTFTIVSQEGHSGGKFTTDRDLAREQEGLELMGLGPPANARCVEAVAGSRPGDARRFS